MVQWTIEQPPAKPDKPLPRRHSKPMPRKKAWVNALRVGLVCFIFALVLASYLLGAQQQPAKPVTAAQATSESAYHHPIKRMDSIRRAFSRE